MDAVEHLPIPAHGGQQGRMLTTRGRVFQGRMKAQIVHQSPDVAAAPGEVGPGGIALPDRLGSLPQRPHERPLVFGGAFLLRGGFRDGHGAQHLVHLVSGFLEGPAAPLLEQLEPVTGSALGAEPHPVALVIEPPAVPASAQGARSMHIPEELGIDPDGLEDPWPAPEGVGYRLPHTSALPLPLAKAMFMLRIFPSVAVVGGTSGAL